MGTVIEALLRSACRPDRLYPIRSNDSYGHYAGRLADGRQALVTCWYPRVVYVYLFTPAGDYLGVERRKPPGWAAAPEWPGPEAHGRELHDFLATEFGFAPELIRVKRFAEASGVVSIEPLPDYLAEFASDPEGVEPEEQADLLESLRKWVEEGSFVLNTCNDYWLNADGVVTAS